MACIIDGEHLQYKPFYTISIFDSSLTSYGIKLSRNFLIDGTKNEITPIIPTSTPPIINVFPIPILSARKPVLNNPIIEGRRLTLI